MGGAREGPWFGFQAIRSWMLVCGVLATACTRSDATPPPPNPSEDKETAALAFSAAFFVGSFLIVFLTRGA